MATNQIGSLKMVKKEIELIYRLNENWGPGEIKIRKAGGQINRNYIVQHIGTRSLRSLVPYSSLILRDDTRRKYSLAFGSLRVICSLFELILCSGTAKLERACIGIIEIPIQQVEALMNFIDVKLNKNKGLAETKLQLNQLELCFID